MKIELLGEDQIKITLSKRDMDRFQITYDELNYQNDKTKDIISDLLVQANRSTGFDGSESRLYVEVFPTEDAGCIFYISSLAQPARKQLRCAARAEYPEPVLFRFLRLEDVITAACMLYDRSCHRVFKSSLYTLHDGYVLVLYLFSPLDKASIRMLLEYGERGGRGGIRASYVEEHGQAIVRDNALDALSLHFS